MFTPWNSVELCVNQFTGGRKGSHVAKGNILNTFSPDSHALCPNAKSADIMYENNFVMASNPIIEAVMQQFKPAIGVDYEKYKNHVYRVFSNCLFLDSNPGNTAKYAIAAVFHDLGIWTDHTFDYLAPSVEQAKRYLMATGQPDWINEIELMINWHHKLSPYKGPNETSVETFRKADWIDVSLGVLTFGLDQHKIKAIRRDRKSVV
mgnify:CR=1 FL=1